MSHSINTMPPTLRRALRVNTDPITNPPAAVAVSEEQELRQHLIDQASTAISSCNWTVGKCAQRWKEETGGTDEEFAQQIGLSQQAVNDRRLTWVAFDDFYRTCGKLSWSHFKAALGWFDAEVWLKWADDNRLSVAEMKRQRAESQQTDAESNTSEPPEGEGERRDDQSDFGRSRVAPSPSDACSEGEADPDSSAVASRETRPAAAPETPLNGKTEAESPEPPLPIMEQMEQCVTTLQAGVTEWLKGEPTVRDRKKIAARLRKQAEVLDPPAAVEIPPKLDTPEFREAWQNWLDYRREIGKTRSPRALSRHLDKLSEHPVETAIAAIEQSISNTWTGLFPEKANGPSLRTSANDPCRVPPSDFEVKYDNEDEPLEPAETTAGGV